MNILHVTDVFSRQPGGVPTFINDLIEATQQHQHMVMTFSYDKKTPKEEDINGVKVYYAKLKTGITPFYSSGQKNMKELINKIKRTVHIDVVHVHMPFSGLAVSSQLVSMPIVYTFHGSWGDEYAFEAKGFKKKFKIFELERRIMKSIERKALFEADVIVTLSDYMRNEVAQYNVDPPLGFVKIPGAVGLDEFHVFGADERQVARDQLHFTNNNLNIFLLRRLVKRVGVNVFIDAISLIKEKRQDFHAYIGGKGPERKSLEKRVSDLGLRSYVTFLGYISDEDRITYYNSSDVSIMPSRTLEGFGLSTLESMACGTPVIGLPTGANTELIGGFDDSLLSVETTAESLAETIMQKWEVLKNGELRSAARSYAEQFSYDALGQAYDELYQKEIV